MTTELTDTELRVKCAGAMGWKKLVGGNPWWLRPDGKLHDSQYTPDYPSDPAAALTLVDKLEKDGWDFFVQKINGLWTVTLKTEYKTIQFSDREFCRAICREFLAVKGKIYE